MAYIQHGAVTSVDMPAFLVSSQHRSTDQLLTVSVKFLLTSALHNSKLSKCVVFNIPTQHITCHFEDKSFQVTNCTGIK